MGSEIFGVLYTLSTTIVGDKFDVIYKKKKRSGKIRFV